LGYVESVQQRGALICLQLLESVRRDTSNLVHRLERVSPRARLEHQKTDLDALANRLQTTTIRSVERHRFEVERLRSVLHSLSPTAILDRGYSLISEEQTGRPISSVHSVQGGDQVRTTLRDGALVLTVDSAHPS